MGTTRKGQSRAVRLARLQRNACPVHGLDMPQIGEWARDNEGKEFTIVGCPRRDCEIRAFSYNPAGPATLTPEWQHLLE
jgi:hypothetical protein